MLITCLQRHDSCLYYVNKDPTLGCNAFAKSLVFARRKSFDSAGGGVLKECVSWRVNAHAGWVVYRYIIDNDFSFSSALCFGVFRVILK